MNWLEPLFPVDEHPHDSSLVAISVAMALAGIGVAYYLYVVRPGSAEGFTKSLGALSRTIANKFYFDEIYDFAIVNPLAQGSRDVLWKGFDRVLIAGTMSGTAGVTRWFGSIFRLLQGGNIRSYAVYILLGAVIFVGIMAVNGATR